MYGGWSCINTNGRGGTFALSMYPTYMYTSKYIYILRHASVYCKSTAACDERIVKAQGWVGRVRDAWAQLFRAPLHPTHRSTCINLFVSSRWRCVDLSLSNTRAPEREVDEVCWVDSKTRDVPGGPAVGDGRYTLCAHVLLRA